MSETRNLSLLDDSPLVQLAFTYCSKNEKTAYLPIFALDLQCASIVLSTQEKMLGQLRLAWWRDVIEKNHSDRPKGNPLIAAMADIAPDKALGMVKIIDSWEQLLIIEDSDTTKIWDITYNRAQALAASCDDLDALQQYEAYILWDVARHWPDDAIRAQCIDHLKPMVTKRNNQKYRVKCKAMRILYRLVRHDVSKGCCKNSLARPEIALRMIFYGLTS